MWLPRSRSVGRINPLNSISASPASTGTNSSSSSTCNRVSWSLGDKLSGYWGKKNWSSVHRLFLPSEARCKTTTTKTLPQSQFSVPVLKGGGNHKPYSFPSILWRTSCFHTSHPGTWFSCQKTQLWAIKLQPLKQATTHFHHISQLQKSLSF